MELLNAGHLDQLDPDHKIWLAVSRKEFDIIQDLVVTEVSETRGDGDHDQLLREMSAQLEGISRPLEG